MEDARELLLLRHAKSAWDAPAATDLERPLSDRGKRDAPRIGGWLQARGLQPDHVVASPARRARQTARRVCRVLGCPAIDWQPRAYLASLPTLLTLLADCPAPARRVLLVGHNPGLEELLAYLCGPELPAPADGKRLPTATLARIALPDDWGVLERDCGRLLAWIRPRDLAPA
jgi:phosphohistidine phosphatase